VAFDPGREGRPLDFEPAESEKTDLILKDRETGSRWSGLTGKCLEGPRKGEELRQLTTTLFVVENWPLHYPKGPTFRAR
jgi:hypothetical protein